MKALVRTEDSVALELFEQGMSVTLESDGLHVNGVLGYPEYKPSGYHIVEGLGKPVVFSRNLWRVENNQWVVNDQAKFDALNSFASSNARTRAKAAVVGFADRFLSQFTQQYPMAEVISWPAKSAAAKAYIAGTADADQTSMIVTEASTKDETSSQVAQKIKQKSLLFEQIVSLTSGLRSKTLARIDAAHVSEIDQIYSEAVAEAKALADQLGVSVPD